MRLNEVFSKATFLSNKYSLPKVKTKESTVTIDNSKKNIPASALFKYREITRVRKNEIMAKNMILDGTEVGVGASPYIVAEMSANHGGNIKNAFKIIKKAKECGASAVKIQTYKPDTITINHD